MNEKELSKKIDDLSINSRKVIIDRIGLSRVSRELLNARYVNELSMNEMCEMFGYDEKYLYKKIAKAKKEMRKIINREYKIMSDELKEYINLLIED